MVLIKRPLFFLQRKPMSISLGIFTTLPLENAQGVHLVLKDGSSYMAAISKGQDTHCREVQPLVNIFQAYSSFAPLAPTTVLPKAPKGCQLPCAFTRILEKKKHLFAEEFHFCWDGHQKFTVSPQTVDWFLVTWPNIKRAAIKWNCEGQMRY